LNQQAIQDFKIKSITKIQLQPLNYGSTLCACAIKCQQTINCVYFESNSSSDENCMLYTFNTPNSLLLKNDLLRGIYYTQSGNTECGISNILFS
jgi:hypothetical protein